MAIVDITLKRLAGIQHAFSQSLQPLVTELQGIHGVLQQHSGILNEHSRILSDHTRILNDHTRILNDHSTLLNEHSQFFRNIDNRLVRVEGLLDGVEILVRRKIG